MPEARARVRIVIADDHALFRDGLRRLLETEPGFEVVGEACDGLEALQLTRVLTPDILLLDVAMPRLNGLDAISSLPDGPTRVVLLTAAVEPGDLLRTIQMGARGAILKDAATRDLIAGLHQVMAGRFVVGGEVAEDLAAAVRQAGRPPAPRYGLTSRELEVVQAIVEGRSNREISESLSISQQTVKHHLTSIFDKTGTSSRLELALLAIRTAIVRAD